METIQKFKATFDPLVAEFLNHKRAECAKILEDDILASYVNQASELVMNGGKRARPYIAWLTYQTLGGRDNPSVRGLLIALELFHTFCLIHDDIMDCGDARHGVQTIHKFSQLRMGQDKRVGDTNHVANAQAILVGDLLASWAWERLEDPGMELSAATLCAVRKEFARMAQQVILGQMIDIDITSRVEAPEALITKKMQLKTASYTFIQPMKIGAALAGKLTDNNNFCENVGTALGLAFQIQDDLLDIVSNETITNKTTLRDIVQRQHTFVTNYTFSHGTSQQQDLLRTAFQKPTISIRAAEQIGDMLRSSTAIEAGQQQVNDYFRQAKAFIEGTPWKSQQKECWRVLVNYLEHRTH